MNDSARLSKHPIRFLLYLEWILLSLLAFSEILAFRFRAVPRTPLLNLLCIVLLGVMGLKLPSNKKFYKIIYTAGEFGLILLASAGGILLLPLLYIITIVRNCFIFEGLKRFIVTSLAFALFVVTQILRLQNLHLPEKFPMPERLEAIVASSTLLFGLVVVFLSLLVNAVLSERKSREELAIANAQLRQYARRIEDIATLQERNRIARDIHDSLGHSLTALNIQLETALKLWQSNPEKAQIFLTEAKRQGSKALQEVRHSVSTLRADPLQGKSIEAAIASLAEEFSRTTNIVPICTILSPSSLPAEIVTAIYRIVQEALTNICKYADASQVEIKITPIKNELSVIIEDNGRGFNIDQNATGFGLQGMRERALALGGGFKIESAPGAGCRITVNFPWQPPA